MKLDKITMEQGFKRTCYKESVMLRFRDIHIIALVPDEIFIKIKNRNPFLEPKSLIECLRAKRWVIGWTIKDAAHRF